jgi:hypothetical protein
MRKVLFVFALVILSLGASVVSAQVPNVQVFFGSDWPGAYGPTHLDQCPPDPPGTIIDSLYVVASNFGMWISAIEYQLVWPGIFGFISDNTGGLNIGNSPAGISTAWPFPINGYVPVLVNKVKFIYLCQLCLSGTNIPITVIPHPVSGFIQVVRWPDNLVFQGVGMISMICPTIPTEDTTWGNIKALYK